MKTQARPVTEEARTAPTRPENGATHVAGLEASPSAKPALRWFGHTLFALAGCLATIAVLGPLLTEAIRYRYSPTMLNQATGLDAFALAVVAPLAVIAGVLAIRRHPAAPLLALAPASFAAYMLAQYVIGPEYLVRDGNAERAFLLFVGAFVLSGAVLLQAWATARAPHWQERLWRRRAALLLGLAVFVVGGLYLATGFLSAMADFPRFVADRAARSEYDEHPTAYWLVAFLDLGVVVPITVATAVGLLRRRPWAARAFYAIVGWYALVSGSVAAMALTMLARNDPAASTSRAVLLTAAATLFLILAGRVFLPLLGQQTWQRPPAGRSHIDGSRS
jgi:hypothetical protein